MFDVLDGLGVLDSCNSAGRASSTDSAGNARRHSRRAALDVRQRLDVLDMLDVLNRLVGVMQTG